MQFDAVIFDMDGVILDSEPHYAVLEKNLFISLKLNISEIEHRTFVGMSMRNMWKKIKANHSTHFSEDQLVELHQNIMVEFFENSDDLELMPNLFELLTTLKKDYKLALASSSSHRLIDIITYKLDIRSFFDCFVSGEDVEKSKPNPEIFLLTAKKMAVDTKRCLVIEDSSHGITAAKEAGMKCVGYNGSNTSVQNLSNADVVIGDFVEFSFDKL